jgi:hypothetical protein
MQRALRIDHDFGDSRQLSNPRGAIASMCRKGLFRIPEPRPDRLEIWESDFNDGTTQAARDSP